VYGIVAPADVDSLIAEISAGLEAIQDPETGERVIERVFRADEIYSGPCVVDAPDLIVGYRPNYRASWDTVLGGFPRAHVLDNRDAWSGDHCIAPQFVPGVLLSSRRLSLQSGSLEDLAPTILHAFGVAIPPGMTGQTLVETMTVPNLQ